MSKMDGGSLGYQTICGVVKLRTRQVADWMIRHVIDSLTSHLLGENIERLSNPRFRKTFSRIHSSANRSVRQLSSFLLTSPRLDWPRVGDRYLDIVCKYMDVVCKSHWLIAVTGFPLYHFLFILVGNSADKLCHPRYVAYSAVQFLLHKQQIWGCRACLHCYLLVSKFACREPNIKVRLDVVDVLSLVNGSVSWCFWTLTEMLQ